MQAMKTTVCPLPGDTLHMHATQVTLAAYFQDKSGQTHALISSPQLSIIRLRGQKIRHVAVYPNEKKRRRESFGRHDNKHLLGSRTFGKVFSTVSVNAKTLSTLDLQPLQHLTTEQALEAEHVSIVSDQRKWDRNVDASRFDQTTVLLSQHANDHVKLPCGGISVIIDGARGPQIGAPVYITGDNSRKLLGFVVDEDSPHVFIIPAHEFTKICNTDIQFMQPGMPR